MSIDNSRQQQQCQECQTHRVTALWLVGACSLSGWRCRARPRGRPARRSRTRMRRPAAAASTRSRSARTGGCWPPAAPTPPTARSWPCATTARPTPSRALHSWPQSKRLWCVILSDMAWNVNICDGMPCHTRYGMAGPDAWPHFILEASCRGPRRCRAWDVAGTGAASWKAALAYTQVAISAILQGAAVRNMQLAVPRRRCR